MLYATLPQYAPQLAIPAVWVGFILSINRLIRPILNPIALRLIQKLGFNIMVCMGILAASVSTLCYALSSFLWLLLAGRFSWAFAFATLRLAALQYASGHTAKTGLHMGVSRAVQEIGPLLSLWFAPFLLSYFTIHQVFVALGLLNLLGLVLLAKLPALTLPHSIISWSFNLLPSKWNAYTFIISFLADGLLVVCLAPLLGLNQKPEQVTALVAFYLIVKRLSVLLLAPLAGMLADKFGLYRVFSGAMAGLFLACLFLVFGLITSGVLLAFLSGSVGLSIAPGGSIARSTSVTQSLSINATWRDLGAGIGSLAAGLLISLTDFSPVFALATCVLALCLLFNLNKLTNQSIFV